jgi:hypothetical protein
LQAGIRLFLFLFSEPSPFGQEQPDSVLKLTHETGGFVFGVTGRAAGSSFLPSWDVEYDDNADARERIRLYTKALNIQVNGFYTLLLETSNRPGKQRKISLEIVDGAGKVSKDVAWTYQRLLPVSGS